jgi:hypothetical protein
MPSRPPDDPVFENVLLAKKTLAEEQVTFNF